MPELIEVERYRSLAERAVGRLVSRVDAPDAWFLKEGLTAPTLAGALVGRTITGARRIGKLLVLDTDGPTLGLRFGMSGRLVVDGAVSVDDFAYASVREEPAWDRVVLGFRDGGDLRVRDPRRLGGVLLAPDESRLGVDATTVTAAGLARLLAGSTAPVKARLMDQGRLAGVGNLIADEVLFRAGIDPARPSGALAPVEVRRLHRHLRAALAELTARGGSHTGDLQPARRAGGCCPRDGAPLLRRTVGGRTTWSCPVHQT